MVLGIEGDVEGWTVGKIRYTAITESGHFSHWHLSLLWAKKQISATVGHSNKSGLRLF